MDTRPQFKRLVYAASEEQSLNDAEKKIDRALMLEMVRRFPVATDVASIETRSLFRHQKLYSIFRSWTLPFYFWHVWHKVDRYRLAATSCLLTNHVIIIT